MAQSQSEQPPSLAFDPEPEDLRFLFTHTILNQNPKLLHLSSLPQKPKAPRPSTTGLARYGSAPRSLLNSAVDSIMGAAADHEFSSLRPQHLRGHYFSGDGGGDSPSLTSSESSFKVNSSNGSHRDTSTTKPLLQSHGLNEIGSSNFSSCSSTSSAALVRQRSSLASFFSHLTASENNGGFSVTRGTGSYRSQGGNNGGHGVTRLKSQLSLIGQDSLSQISEVSENAGKGVSTDNGHHSAMHSYPATSLGMESWDNTNSVVFSAPPSKRAKNMDGDIFNFLNALESQFSLPHTSLEMATVDKLLHILEDFVPCKIRAKRGCATHPRSIAERASDLGCFDG
ncbi:hypothetical protein ACFX2J_034294 [Malus domestica]|uniref:transcription factor bHLH128-like n=1 Tax=Malus domestica TaxID=3750 RepID=UPI000498A615|nr:transcription factor bHLH128-like [Malus domestica]